jgi:3-dehydroquinate synthase
MRGIDFINIPTTTLAMVDAAYGGKTGIDFNNVKNLIGSFYQPIEIFIDPNFMNTLPEIELQSGFAEIIKYAIIADKNLFDILNKWDGYIPNIEIIEKCLAIKKKFVTEDLLDNGIRMHLNFGHTIGHAIEREYLTKGTPLPHGFAVAEGMIAETEIAIENDSIECFKYLYKFNSLDNYGFYQLE